MKAIRRATATLVTAVHMAGPFWFGRHLLESGVIVHEPNAVTGDRRTCLHPASFEEQFDVLPAGLTDEEIHWRLKAARRHHRAAERRVG